MWAKGRAHAAVHHVTNNAAPGDAIGVADLLDAFSAEHSLPYGLGSNHVELLTTVVKDRQEKAHQMNVGAPWITVLNVRAGLGAESLRSIPRMLEAGRAGSIMQVVNVEEDDHLSELGKKLVTHVLQEGKGSAEGPIDFRQIHHSPDEGTQMEEVLAALKTKGVGRYDLVLLGGEREKHQSEVEALLKNHALHRGAVIHSDGPPRGDPATDEYLKFLQASSLLDKTSRKRVTYEVHDMDGPNGPAAVIVATVPKVKEMWDLDKDDEL